MGVSIFAQAFVTSGDGAADVSTSSGGLFLEIVALGFLDLTSRFLAMLFFEIFFLTRRTETCSSGLGVSAKSEKILVEDVGVSINAQSLASSGDGGMAVLASNPGTPLESDNILTEEAGVSTSAQASVTRGDGGMGVLDSNSGVAVVSGDIFTGDAGVSIFAQSFASSGDAGMGVLASNPGPAVVSGNISIGDAGVSISAQSLASIRDGGMGVLISRLDFLLGTVIFGFLEIDFDFL